MAGYSKDKAVATVAAQAGADAEDVENLYDSVKELMAGYSKDKAVATVAKQASIPENSVAAVYDAVNEAISGGAAPADAYAAVAGATGQTADAVESIYKNVAGLMAKKDLDTAAAIAAPAAGKTAEEVKEAVNGVDSLMAEKDLDTAAAIAAPAAGKTAEEVKAAVDGVDSLMAEKDLDTAAAIAAPTAGKTAAEITAAVNGVDSLMAKKDLDTAAAIAAAASGASVDDVKTGYSMGSPEAQKEALTNLEMAKAAYEGVKELEDGYSYEKAIATVAAATGNDVATVKKGYENGDPASQKAIQAQLDEYTNGQKKLQAAAAQLAAAPAQLAEAEQKLADGEDQIAEGTQKLADAAAQLAEYEDGVAQAKDGLQQVIDTEADPGIESITDRLGAGFTYVKPNGDLDIPQGFVALDSAWAYKADDGAAITDEMYTRIYGAVAAIIASVMALIAAFLGWKKKFKGALPCAGISAVAAAAASVFANKAGMYFSTAAGSSLGSFALYAGAILAAVALIHAIADGAAAKAK